MYELKIRENDLIVEINKEKVNASIDIYDDEKINLMLILLSPSYQLSLETTYRLLAIYNGYIPSHKIGYDESVASNNLNLNNFNLSNLDNEDILQENVKEIKKLLKKYKGDEVTIYECKHNRDIVTACLYHFLTRGHVLKKCECCNKYFVTIKKKNEKYCIRLNDNGKTCRDIMAHKSRIESQNKEPRRTERNVYNNLLKNSSSEILDKFMNAKDIKKKEYKDGIISLEEYLSWLKSFNKHKKN